MNFSSSLFILYFLPSFLLLYFISGQKARKIIILLASIFFFLWTKPSFLVLLIITLIIEHYLVYVMYESNGKAKRIILIFLLLMNISILVYYKYTHFFYNQFAAWLNLPDIGKIILPAGISFIAFQKISYLVDVYRKTTTPARSLTDYMIFILFFPKILAGPIVRFNAFSSDLSAQNKNPKIEERLNGFFRFSLGLVKKVMIANVLGEFADEIFSTNTSMLNTSTAWIGALTYSFQIYFDFSAYSDMAIGLGRIIGFRIPENFNNPYVSVGITGFWKRWHITLGTWLRDYLFLPSAYAFSRKMPEEKYLKLKTEKWIYIFATMLTMVICGFWHGAGWTFIIWGFYHGFIMALEKLFLMRLLKRSGKIISVAFTFFVVVIGWVMFRADSVSYAFDYYSVMFSLSKAGSDFMITPQLVILLIVSGIFSFSAIIKRINKWQITVFEHNENLKGIFLRMVATIILFVVGLSYVTASGFNPFIYFRF